jgi:hypothetical protein
MKYLGPVKSIRRYCLECSAGSAREVKLCEVENCPLFIYRFGKNPNRRGIGGQKAGHDPFDLEAKRFNKRATQVGKIAQKKGK